MADLLCFTVSVGDFPKTLTQSNDFIAAVADGNQIIEGVAVAVDVALAGHITRLHVNLDFVHNCSPVYLFYLKPDNSGVSALFLQRVETLKTHHAIQ